MPRTGQGGGKWLRRFRQRRKASKLELGPSDGPAGPVRDHVEESPVIANDGSVRLAGWSQEDADEAAWASTQEALRLEQESFTRRRTGVESEGDERPDGWDAVRETIRRTLRGHTEQGRTVNQRPDGWDGAREAVRRALRGHTEPNEPATEDHDQDRTGYYSELAEGVRRYLASNPKSDRDHISGLLEKLEEREALLREQLPHNPHIVLWAGHVPDVRLPQQDELTWEERQEVAQDTAALISDTLARLFLRLGPPPEGSSPNHDPVPSGGGGASQ
ncbi:hypothetical protein ACFUG9_02890 [Streptomyces griseoincarnatus]